MTPEEAVMFVHGMDARGADIAANLYEAVRLLRVCAAEMDWPQLDEFLVDFQENGALMPDPIWIPCEGSGYPVNVPIGHHGFCKMCGRRVVILTARMGSGDVMGDVAEAHNREDVLAEIARGDFG